MTRKAACVIGWPAKHSRSPKLHGWWLQHYRIDGDYRAEEIAPAEFPAFVRDLAGRGYIGANVTLPHKEMALALSEPDARAHAVGAANTLWLENGALKSTNTDVEGFLGALDASAPDWQARSRNAVVLGAGGAARAVVWGLLERGIGQIVVVNRTLAKAEELRRMYGPAVRPAAWDELSRYIEGATLLVNTTSLGMKGYPDLDIDLARMADAAVVSDIVYVPLRTPLLQQAEARGFATSNGLDMLLYQAVRGFELWFGVRPEVSAEQRSMLVRDIEGTP